MDKHGSSDSGWNFGRNSRDVRSVGVCACGTGLDDVNTWARGKIDFRGVYGRERCMVQKSKRS